MNGVYKVIAKGQHEYWVVIWYEDKKAFKKHFSITSLGNEKALHLAKEFRQKQIEKLNLNGYGYSERHVKDKMTVFNIKIQGGLQSNIHCF